MASFGSELLRENLIRRIFKGESDTEWPVLTGGLDVALFLTVADPTPANLTEIVGTGYARINVAFAAWDIGAAPTFTADNAVTVDFGQMAADWVDGGLNQILSFGLYENATNDLYVVADLDTPVTIAANLPLVFLQSTLTARLQ